MLLLALPLLDDGSSPDLLSPDGLMNGTTVPGVWDQEFFLEAGTDGFLGALRLLLFDKAFVSFCMLLGSLAVAIRKSTNQART